MNSSHSGDIDLAADFTGKGKFAAVGFMRAPAIAFAALIKDLQNERALPEREKEDLVHALAAKTAGRCILTGSEMEAALRDCMAANLICEWRISMPGIGSLQALFLIIRLRSVENETGLFDLALQLAGKPSFRARQPEQEAIG